MASPANTSRAANKSSQAVSEVDEDDISITSTISSEHAEDDDFGVDDILAEKTGDDGKVYYLLQWTDYPLWRASYEPEAFLSEELREVWAEKKRYHEEGRAKLFDVSEYEKAVEVEDEAKAARHSRRNAKRKRLGLAPTEPFDPEPSTSASGSDSKSDSGSSDEALEDNTVQDKIPSTQPKQPTRTPRQKIFKGIPVSSTPKSAPSTRRAAEVTDPKRSSTTEKKGKPAAAKATPAAAPQKSTSASKQPRPEPQSITGYQGTARKPSMINPLNRHPPTLPKPAMPPRGSSLLNKVTSGKGALPFKAKKTGTSLSAQQPGPPSKPVLGNAFVDGKQRKQRKNLVHVISDPSKDKKLFNFAHQRRIAELRGREKGDGAPEAAAIPGKLFPISQGPGNVPNNGTSQPPALNTAGAVAYSANESARSSSGVSSLGEFPRPSKKKRKSVRFSDFPGSDYSGLHEEPVEISSDVDEPLIDGGVPISRRRDSQPAIPAVVLATNLKPVPVRKVSLAAYNARGSTQLVKKKVTLGSCNGTQLDVTFDGVPRDATPPQWLVMFLKQETLEFGHSCFGESLIAQWSSLRQESLCNGSVAPAMNGSSLEQAAEFLRAAASGLYFSHSYFNILIYPTKCEEWKVDQLGVEPSSAAGVNLKYVAFSSPIDCGPFLRPLSVAKPSTPNSAREDLMDRILHLGAEQYADLLPQATLQPGKLHAFYLAFPPSAYETLQQIGLWLRASNADNILFTGQHPGGWAAFVDHVVEKDQPGTVLIHESAVWAIRRFPNLVTLLDKGAGCSFWYLSLSVHSPQIFPSRRPGLPTTSLLEPGRSSLVPLFQQGTAIFVTPSFLVSEPRRAYELFSWFLRARKTEGRLRLVTAWHIQHYLQILANEKAQQRRELLKELESAAVVDREIAANLKGISEADCNFRYKTWQKASELLGFREIAFPWAPYEENSPVIYADETLDANDEQSLVNWFGWWSNIRVDQFRSFHVVGSSLKTQLTGSEKARRTIPIPTFSQGTVPNPDTALNRLDEQHIQLAVPLQEGLARQGHVGSQRPSPDGVNGGRNELPPQIEVGRSQLLEDDRWRTISNALKGLPSWSKSWRIFGFAVLWKDGSEAYRFGTIDTRNQTINDWWGYVWSFLPDGPGVPPSMSSNSWAFHTYIGFFYTVIDGSDPKETPAGQAVQRHPWLAIYRPVNPHIKPYQRTEVVIWDPAAKYRFPDDTVPREDNLSAAQQELIRCVRTRGEEKNKGTHLSQVWLGGFQHDETYKHPLDISFDFLNSLCRNLRVALPEADTELPTRGFRQVTMCGAAAGLNAPIPRGVDSEAPAGHAGAEAAKEGQAKRVVFHPPRRMRPTQEATKCNNHLYEQVRLAKLRDDNAQSIDYVYRPTMEWYADQKSEGRGFEHVNVNTWEDIFNTFKIGPAP